MVRGYVFLVLISASRASAKAEIAEKAFDHLPSLELINRLFANDNTPSADHHRQLVKGLGSAVPGDVQRPQGGLVRGSQHVHEHVSRRHASGRHAAAW